MMKRLIFLLVAILLLAGCFSLPRETFEVVRYTFRPMDLQGPVGPSHESALLIMPFKSSAVQPGDRIVFKDHNQEMSTYYYHRWIASPQMLLADILSEDMVGSELFADGVYVMTSSVAPSHELQGRLVHMYADNRRGEEAAVVEIVMSVFRLDPQTYEKILVLQKPYRYRVERDDGKVESYIPAVTEAVGLWLADVRLDMNALLQEDAI
jgi:ABC-type uncharacterized transport system auxiliary subunit